MNPFNKKTYKNCWAGHEYAEKVVAGEIVANIYIIGACKRYLRDIEAENHPYFYFDKDKAETYLRKVQQFEHINGKWANPKIVYEPWQLWVFMNIMGFINRETGFRRFRTAHIEIARGNGKSAMASQACLYFGFLDSPNGNQVATVATKKEQARIVLDAARAMARRNKGFLKATGVRVLAHTVVQDSTDSVVRALSAEASGLDGLNDVLAVCDELHAMRRETFDVINSGMSKRSDSLLLCITTAGFDVDSVGYSQSTYAKKVAIGEYEDETFFSAVYCLDEKDYIYDEKLWPKANPNWGVSVDAENFKARAEKAKVTPADVANFKVKHLDMWVSEAKAFFSLEKWDACADPTLKIEQFKSEKCRLGLDLASNIDITSIVPSFYKDGIYYFFFDNFIPEATVKELRNTLYDESIASGDLIATPGEAINYDYIREKLLAYPQNYRVAECGYDAWNATETAQKTADKIEMVKIPMNVGSMSEPMKKFDSLMREGKIRHNGSKLVRWMVGNVVAKEDHNGNVYPRKSHSKLKIDAVVAALMSLALWLQDKEKESVYAERGIRVVGRRI